MFTTAKRLLQKFHQDERGEVTTQQLLYLAIGAIVAAILYKYGGRLVKIVEDFISGAEGNDTNVEPLN